MFTDSQCQQARLSRDKRFDGLFFVAVKSTGIYCRPICPAPAAKEHNVQYFEHAHQAAHAGFRPCIRCRPDASPSSYAWLGNETTAIRAKQLIDQGQWARIGAKGVAARLGISQSYLNQLFKKTFGIAPSQYDQFTRCQFAKNLLQQSSLSITDIAFASGFNSVRRFNDAFQKQLQLSPSQLRKTKSHANGQIQLFIAVRPPYNWEAMQRFLAARCIAPMEWVGDSHFGRTFTIGTAKGEFTATFNEQKLGFDVAIQLDDWQCLQASIATIRRILDTDADTHVIAKQLCKAGVEQSQLTEGLRLPGLWNTFEAAIRAVLGQQVSVAAARNLCVTLVHELGEQGRFFPTPQAIAQSELSFFKMPQARKNALRALAQFVLDHHDSEPQDWLDIKGIGPWTVQYTQMRGQSDPDVYLGGDLGVKKAFAQCQHIDTQAAAPFRSYLTFQLWQWL